MFWPRKIGKTEQRKEFNVEGNNRKNGKKREICKIRVNCFGEIHDQSLLN